MKKQKSVKTKLYTQDELIELVAAAGTIMVKQLAGEEKVGPEAAFLGLSYVIRVKTIIQEIFEGQHDEIMKEMLND